MGKLEEIIKSYDGDNLMNVLNLIQKEEGCLSEEIIKIVSEKLNIPLGILYSTVSFYSFLSFKKSLHTIRICECLSCHLNDVEEMILAIEEITGLKPGESNDKFKIEITQCIGCCDRAPAMLLDDEIYDKLTKEKLKIILSSC